ncbi:hypothetical protein ACWEOW_11150 [Monashia sp. NPDC004114]
MITNDERIGLNLAAIRQSAGLSQDGLARLMTDLTGHKWQQTLIARTELGRRPLRLAEAVELTVALNSSLEALAHGPDRVARARVQAERLQRMADDVLRRAEEEEN